MKSRFDRLPKVTKQPSFDYGPCPTCDGVLTIRYDGSPHAWRDDLVFQLGVVCECGFRSIGPPTCIRRGDQFWVQVPELLQCTERGRIHALHRIPFAWRRGSFTWEFTEEQQHGWRRWWQFERKPLDSKSSHL